MAVIAPAILPASRTELEGHLARLGSASRIQIDVVDGKLATPASWPYRVAGELSTMVREGYMLPRVGEVEYEIDLMTLDAAEAVGPWLTLGASRFTFHIETALNEPNLFPTIIRTYGDLSGASFGLAINTTTDLGVLDPFVEHLSYLQCMGIARIGRQGQPFDRRTLAQIRELRKRYPTLPIQVDGGVTIPVAKKLLTLGVTALVVGSAILGAPDPEAALHTFEALENPFGV